MNKANWRDVNIKYGTEFPNFLSLVDLILIIPAHSVECERGFSLMKRIKTNARSSLGKDTLTTLMHITLQSPDEDMFNPLPAIQLWNSAARRKRRPFQPPYKHSTTAKQSSQSDDESDVEIMEEGEMSDEDYVAEDEDVYDGGNVIELID